MDPYGSGGLHITRDFSCRSQIKGFPKCLHCGDGQLSPLLFLAASAPSQRFEIQPPAVATSATPESSHVNKSFY